MIEISPSVLTNSIEDFNRFVKAYEIFETVDIDIIKQPFLEDETIGIAHAVKILKGSSIKSIGFHLMVADPQQEMDYLKSMGFDKRELRIYLQQEVDIKFLDNYDWPMNWRKGICLKLDTRLKNLDFYRQFAEVQLMSIEIGKQGTKFDDSVIDKIEELREIGYNGVVSLDGGINLKSADIVRHLDIQRVSPGSYFAKASDIELAKMKLEIALNIKDGFSE